jgi:hypothetical protein
MLLKLINGKPFDTQIDKASTILVTTIHAEAGAASMNGCDI